MRYASKIDWWLLGLLVFLVLLGSSVIVAQILLGVQPLSAGILLVLPVTVVSWLFLSTYYQVDQSYLWVRSGPFRWQIPLKGIVSVYPTHNSVGGPALSIDRLCVEYQLSSGHKRTLLISPAQKTQFLEELAEAEGSLEFLGDHIEREATSVEGEMVG